MRWTVQVSTPPSRCVAASSAAESRTSRFWEPRSTAPPWASTGDFYLADLTYALQRMNTIGGFLHRGAGAGAVPARAFPSGSGWANVPSRHEVWGVRSSLEGLGAGLRLVAIIPGSRGERR